MTSPTPRYQVYRDGKPVDGFPSNPDRTWAERDRDSMKDADRDLNRGKHRYSIRKVTT